MVDEFVKDSTVEYNDGYHRTNDEFDDDTKLDQWWYQTVLPLFGWHM